MITRFVDVDYRPDATCPRWEKFLEEIFPYNPELPAYMQRLIGYGITGSTAEQCFAVLWGKGRERKIGVHGHGHFRVLGHFPHDTVQHFRGTPKRRHPQRPSGPAWRSNRPCV